MDAITNQEQIAQLLSEQFNLQRQSFLNSDIESYAERKTHLKNLKRVLTENREELFAALNKDYGCRSYHESLFAEYIAVIDDINSTIKHLKKWMKPQKRKVDHTMYFGAKNRLIPQPLGVVGVIVPWNFPLNLMFSQLSAIFASGNSAMVKMSENSLNLCAALQKLSGKYFSSEKLQIFTESGCVGIEFSKLPFDHLIFTGSGATGRKVMAACANNLTPVTLELGGKCPAIVVPDYPLAKAVERILFVKQFNAGQICTTVDYVFVHKSQLDAFIELARSWVKKHIPDIASENFTSVIDDKSYQRILDTLEDAKDKGARVINLCGQEAVAEKRKIPVTLVLDSNEEMLIRNRETFGPVLMVLTYDTADEVINYINSKDRPLALYPFTKNIQLVEKYISRIMSGGVTVNDALYHVAQHDLPFGGVGASGMGHYHGYDGFITFSKMRPVMYQANTTSGKFLMPPYSSGSAAKILNFMAKIKS